MRVGDDQGVSIEAPGDHDPGVNLVEPGCEAMVRLQMLAASIDGSAKGTREAYEGALHSAAELGSWVEVDAETENLFINDYGDEVMKVFDV